MSMKPSTIKLLVKKQQVLIEYANDRFLIFDSAFLRAASPSAENKKNLKNINKKKYKNIKITNIEKVGNYALRFFFDDSHSTGIYSWEYLLEISHSN